ncbi:MAG: hypothetical protein ACFCVF_03510 [Kineosporiaceae bacterium]
MGHELEAPWGEHGPDWNLLYRARGDEVSAHRPVFTGDVFGATRVQGIPDPRERTVIIVQHPCALRTDGVDLAERLIVGEVKPARPPDRDGWRGNFGRMPLPDLRPDGSEKKRHQSAVFDNPYLVARDALDPANRIACLSQTGVNLLLQRWVCHNSRVVVPTFQYQEVTRGQFDEADLIEEWCESRIEDGVAVDEATREAVAWLREPSVTGGRTRQALLDDPQQVSAVRQDLWRHLRALPRT